MQVFASELCLRRLFSNSGHGLCQASSARRMVDERRTLTALTKQHLIIRNSRDIAKKQYKPDLIASSAQAPCL